MLRNVEYRDHAHDEQEIPGRYPRTNTAHLKRHRGDAEQKPEHRAIDSQQEQVPHCIKVVVILNVFEKLFV